MNLRGDILKYRVQTTLELRISRDKMDPDRAPDRQHRDGRAAVLPLGRAETVLVVESERERRLRKRGDASRAGIRTSGV